MASTSNVTCHSGTHPVCSLDCLSVDQVTKNSTKKALRDYLQNHQQTLDSKMDEVPSMLNDCYEKYEEIARDLLPAQPGNACEVAECSAICDQLSDHMANTSNNLADFDWDGVVMTGNYVGDDGRASAMVKTQGVSDKRE